MSADPSKNATIPAPGASRRKFAAADPSAIEVLAVWLVVPIVENEPVVAAGHALIAVASVRLSTGSRFDCVGILRNPRGRIRVRVGLHRRFRDRKLAIAIAEAVTPFLEPSRD